MVRQNPTYIPRHYPVLRRPQTISFQLVTRMAGNFSHLGLAEQFFLANLEIFILGGPLHDRYIRPLHRRGTVTPAILGRRPLGRLSFGALS